MHISIVVGSLKIRT